MKKVIFSLNIGSYQNYPTIEYFKEYANKCGADYIGLEKQVVNLPNPFYEKFYFVELLNEYDRVLYIDSDIIITPWARDIFSHLDDTECFYAFPENFDLPIMDRDICVKPFLEKYPDWPRQVNGKLQYFNAGVFLTSKKHQKEFMRFRDIPKMEGVFEDDDQNYLNYLIVSKKIPFKSLPFSFNRMHLGQSDPNNLRYMADFIHYAGNKDFYGNESKDLTILKDLNKLYVK